MLSCIFWFFLKLSLLALAVGSALICVGFVVIVLLVIKDMVFD